MKAFKLSILAIFAAIALNSCSGLQDTPETETTPTVAADGGVSALDRNSVISCGVWEPIPMTDEAGTEFVTAEIINSEEDVYFWVEVPAEYRITYVTGWAGNIEEVPHDGNGNVSEEGFLFHEWFEDEIGPMRNTIEANRENVVQEVLLSFTRSTIEDCSAFAIRMDIEIIDEDGNSEGINHTLWLDGTAVHNVTALQYCVQDC